VAEARQLARALLSQAIPQQVRRAPGLGPDGYAQTITTLADAEKAAVAWTKFLDDPGPVVIGATQGASCFGAAYEFLFNTSHQLRKAKLHGRVPLTFVTAEPFLGHFGIGGLPGGEKLLKMFLHKEGITAVTGMAMDEVTGDQVKLADGTGSRSDTPWWCRPSSGRTS
jgi:hypothetical protein